MNQWQDHYPHDETDDWEPDEEDTQESGEFRHFVRLCPHCRQPVTREMDSCPYCGDIIFRHLTEGTFAPRRGFWAKVLVLVILVLVFLAALSFLFSSLGIL